mgnify:CR=1 FL=1
MDYIKKIVLNWILYSSDLVYTYKTKCKIVRYVKENLNDALLVASGLYFLDKDSEKIIVSAKGHNFLEDMNRYKYAFFKRKDLLIEKFLSENANRYKNTDMHISGSYLENLYYKKRPWKYNQIVGYILSEDPTYITSYNNARGLIRKLDRDELLKILVASYLAD